MRAAHCWKDHQGYTKHQMWQQCLLCCALFLYIKIKQKGDMLVTRGSGKYKAAAVHVKIKCPCERGRNLSLSKWLCHQKKEHQSHCSQACYNFLFFYTLDNNTPPKLWKRPVRKFYSSVLAEIFPLSDSLRSFSQTLSLKGWNQLTSVSCDFSFRVIMSCSCTDILSKPLTGQNYIMYVVLSWLQVLCATS